MSFISKVIGPTPAKKHILQQGSSIFSQAVGTHLDRVSEAQKKKKYFKKNTMFDSGSAHLASGNQVQVPGAEYETITGPQKNKQSPPDFVLFREKGFGVGKFDMNKNGHYGGPANTLVPYKRQQTALATQQSSPMTSLLSQMSKRNSSF